MTRSSILNSIRLGNQLLNILILALGLAGGYFMTIQSLKIELAAKAESRVVETLDKRLGELEVVIREAVVSRDQFYEFSQTVEQRLGRIEFYLTEHKGPDRETP